MVSGAYNLGLLNESISFGRPACICAVRWIEEERPLFTVLYHIIDGQLAGEETPPGGALQGSQIVSFQRLQFFVTGHGRGGNGANGQKLAVVTRDRSIIAVAAAGARHHAIGKISRDRPVDQGRLVEIQALQYPLRAWFI